MVSFQGRGKSTRLLREAGGIRDGRRGTFTFFFQRYITSINCLREAGVVGDDGRRTIFQFPPNAVKFDKLTNRRGGGC